MIRLLVLALLALAQPAAAEGRRVALVIANSAYAQIEPLTNPVNDGKLVAVALTRAGFAVDVRDNLDLTRFLQALRDFRGQADGAEVALIYYAGHGVQTDGENFLVPTDAEVAASPDLQFEAIDLERLMATLGGATMRVAILDACRNNPFKSAATVTKVTRGLAQVDVDGVLLIYSAAPGQPASDGDGANSPFAAALARHLPQPGLALQLLGGVVRDEVIKNTNNTQRPHISASVTGTPYYLVAPPQPGTGTPSVVGAAVGGLVGNLIRPPATLQRGTPPPAPLASTRWTVSDPKLPMKTASVTRADYGATYKYTVAGTYPTAKRTGEGAPQARFIRVVPRRVVGNRVMTVVAARRLSIGSWAPGAPFQMSFDIDKALVDATTDLELRLCMGGRDESLGGDPFCFYSPNLVEGGPQRLINVNPPRRPGIARRPPGS